MFYNFLAISELGTNLQNLKENDQGRAGNMARSVNSLLQKCKDLSSHPNAYPQKTEREKKKSCRGEREESGKTPGSLAKPGSYKFTETCLKS